MTTKEYLEVELRREAYRAACEAAEQVHLYGSTAYEAAVEPAWRALVAAIAAAENARRADAAARRAARR